MKARSWMAVASALWLAGCGGGGLTESTCTGSCATRTPQRLEVADVERVMAQAINEAQARGVSATIAVTDRSGNVLGVFRMNGADTEITVNGGRGIAGGLEGITIIPDSLAAIAKAITGAYLSSEGNAFSTRTASQIVQESFNPGESDQPGGPLFGVQFSQLPCSDLSTRFSGMRPSPGPHRSPLGLSADPGGFPLYKGGVPVGGVGVIADGRYGLDLSVFDDDSDRDELIALAATRGFDAPEDRRGDRITVDGKTLRYSDARVSQLIGGSVPAFSVLDGIAGKRIAVPGYTGASDSIVAGLPFSQPESGFRPAAGALGALDGFVIVDGADSNRFAPRAATDAAVTGVNAITANEVQVLLEEALQVANRTRAQIRRPLSTPARVTISVVDSFGSVLGIVRTRDAPVFGTDVSLQKARSAMFFSNAAADDDLLATPDTTYLGNGQTQSIANYVPAARNFFGRADILDGGLAFAARSIGNAARPYFPDGLRGSGNGPLSKPFSSWSPFSVGLQLDLVNSAILQHVVFVLGGGADVAAGACNAMPVTLAGQTRLANGLQIFAGGVPLYRGNGLVGGIGISGDGIDQDDMIAFLGAHNAGVRLGTGLGNAPAGLRADAVAKDGNFLRYVQCPQSPFLDTGAQNVCQGK